MTPPLVTLTFFESCVDGVAGAAVGEGAFGDGPAIWVGTREVAHLDGPGVLDIRLTRGVIRERRRELRADDRVTLRPGTSDWIELAVREAGDLDAARSLIASAIEANRSTAPPGPPPAGAELERRRRFH